MRKLAAFIVAASAALILTSCAAPAKSSSPGTDKISGEITYAHWDPKQEKTVDTLIAAFEKENPKVTVTQVVVPFAQYWTTIQTKASSGTLPDVFWMNMPNFKLYASNGQLAPIDNLVESGQIDPSKYPQNLTDFYRWDGVRYAVPKDIDTNAMWVNKALFDQAGLPLPSKDWTYDDFRATAKDITDALSDKGVYGTAFYPYGQTTYYSSIFAYGGSVIADDGRSGWNKPGSAKGLQIWADILADGSSPSLQQLSESSADQLFLSGKVAMFPTIAGASVTLMGTAAHAADYVALPLPQGDRKATVGHALANAVSAKSKNKPAAQAFQAFLASEEGQRIQAKSGVMLSAYEGMGAPFVESYPNLGLQTFVDAIGYSFPYPAMKNSDAWAAAELPIVGQALAGAITVEDAMKQLDKALNAAVDKE